MNNYQPKNAGLIDKHLIYPIANIFSCFVYKIGLTPNIITFITFAIRSVAIYYMFLKQQPKLIFTLFIISWFTDALDGIVARKYDMKSELGAQLDSIVDITTVTATLIALLLNYYNNNLNDFIKLVVLIVLSFFIMSIKLKSNNDAKSSKPWEKILSCIPVDFKSNKLIDAIDPGFSYLIILCGLYHGLFKINK